MTGGMTYAGIDVSTKTIDVVLLELDTDNATWRSYDLGRGDAIARVRRIARTLPPAGAWKDANVVQITLERPYGDTLKGGIPLAWAFGAVLTALPTDRAVQLLISEPWDWKLWSLGAGDPDQKKGNADKAAVRAWVRDRWPNMPAGASQNALDAYAIAFAGRAISLHHAPTDGPTRAREELLT